MTRGIVYLESTDDLAAVERRIAQAADDEVLLVVPRGFAPLRRPVNTKLVARHAQRLGKTAALATSDGAVREAGRAAGLSVFGHVGWAQRARWRRPEAVRLFRRQKAEGRRQKAEGSKLPATYRLLSAVRRLLAVPVLLIALAVGAGLVLAVVPEATVVVHPAVRDISADFELVADPQLDEADPASGKVPARLIETTFVGRAEASTASQKDAPDQPAKGQVTFVNRRTEPTTVPQGTIVSTSAGTRVRFRTEEAVDLPPRGSARVPVVAVDPGLSGNVPAGTINRVEPTLALAVNVVNNEPTRGGSVKRVGVVTNADKTRLREHLMTRLQLEAANNLQQKLEPGEYLPVEGVTFETFNELYNAGVDQETDVLTLQARVRASGIAIPSLAAGTMAAEALAEQVPRNFKLLPETLRFQPRRVLEVNPEGGQVRFLVQVWGQVRADFGRDEVIAAVRGKPVEQATAALSARLPLDGPPSISVEPDWLGRVPWFPLRIKSQVVRESGNQESELRTN
jgi:hypothetical protein